MRGGDGRDRIDFARTVATRGHDLSAAAEKIVVAPGRTLRTDGGADGTVGDIVLAAAATSTDALAAADSSVTMVDATLIGRNITISASATFISAADFIDGGSAASVDIFGSEVTAARTITIDVHSFVLATTDAAEADVTVTSTAAARIGGAATLEAGGDLAVDVANVVDVTAAGGPAAVATIALETIALVDGGATLAAQDVSLHAASDATLALADVVAVAEFESTVRADVAGGLAIDLGRRASLASAESGVPTVAGTRADEAPRPAFDRDPARPIDAAADAAAIGDDEATPPISTASRRGGRCRRRARRRRIACMPVPANGSRARSLPPGTFDFVDFAAEPQLDGTPAADGVIARGALAASAGAIALLPTTDADADPRNGRRPGVESEPDGDDGDTGLGASLALSMIKDSALAELARSVATGGGVALSASGTPFVRGRARGAPGSDEAEAGGALEIRDADPTGTVILAEADESAGDPGRAGSDRGADDRNALHFPGADKLVLATATRHDLVAEASGGAERGTAVTAATPIDVTNADATAELAAADTFTLAVLSAAADAVGAAPEGAGFRDASDGGVAGLALSTDLPALEFEVVVGAQDAIGSGDDVGALAGAHAIAVSGLLDPAVLAPAAAPGGTSGHDVGELVALSRCGRERWRGRGHRRGRDRRQPAGRDGVPRRARGADCRERRADAARTPPHRRRVGGSRTPSRGRAGRCDGVREPRGARRASRRVPQRRSLGREVRERARPRAGRSEPEREDQDQALASDSRRLRFAGTKSRAALSPRRRKETLSRPASGGRRPQARLSLPCGTLISDGYSSEPSPRHLLRPRRRAEGPRQGAARRQHRLQRAGDPERAVPRADPGRRRLGSFPRGRAAREVQDPARRRPVRAPLARGAARRPRCDPPGRRPGSVPLQLPRAQRGHSSPAASACASTRRCAGSPPTTCTATSSTISAPPGRSSPSWCSSPST